MTDDELYGAYLAGDSAAGDELMLRGGDALMAYLNAFLHDPRDAEELMLDCYARILVDRPKIGEGRFRAYLYRMARNRANRLWRVRFRRREFSLDEALPAEGGTPEESVFAGERSETLRACLNRIAPQYREALCLVYEMGFSYAQAAEVLRCGEKRIDNLLSGGKKQLRRELQKEGITRADL